MFFKVFYLNMGNMRNIRKHCCVFFFFIFFPAGNNNNHIYKVKIFKKSYFVGRRRKCCVINDKGKDTARVSIYLTQKGETRYLNFIFHFDKFAIAATIKIVDLLTISS